MFTPAFENLVVSGLIQPDSGQWTLAHWQGVLLARVAEAGTPEQIFSNPQQERTREFLKKVAVR